MKSEEVAAVIGQARAVQEESDAERTPVPDGLQEVDFSIPLQKAGQVVHGVFLGEVEPFSMQKVDKGEVKIQEVRQFAIQRFKDGAVTKVLGSTFLEQFFDARTIGEEVWLKRLGQRGTNKGQRLNEYQCAFGPAGPALDKLTAAGFRLASVPSAKPEVLPQS